MWKSLVKFVIIICIGALVFSREAKAFPFSRLSRNVNLNLFGDASIFSINIEKFLINDWKFFLAGKIGVGFSETLAMKNDNTALISTPVHLTGNFGQKKHYLEVGIGAVALFDGKLKYWDYSVYPIIGYRYHPFKYGRVSLRVYASYPLTGKIDIHKYWFSPLGLTVGYCFK